MHLIPVYTDLLFYFMTTLSWGGLFFFQWVPFKHQAVSWLLFIVEKDVVEEGTENQQSDR